MHVRPAATILAIALSAGLAAVAAQARPVGNLGKIDFPTSAAGEAQDHFLRGALLLHSFEYDDAAEEFQAAQKADPGFAMAYWGEAMTKNHPLWMDRDAEGARKILARLAATPEARRAKAPTPREARYLAAVEALYADGDKRERDLAYAEAMRRLHEEFPADLEAQCFYALALLGSCENRRDSAVYMKGAALLEEAFAKNPLHPGAVHYLIHSYDDPVHAPLGLRPARVYAKIASAAAHALHMPSHIFFAMGMWDEVVASNEASWAAADARRIRKHLPASERGWHGIFWREYALLQQGRLREAQALLEIAEADAKSSGLTRVLTARSEMRAVWAIETNCRSGPSAPEDSSAPRDVFVRGYCAFRKGDAAGVAAAVSELKAPASETAADASAHAHAGMTGPGGYGGAGGSVANVLRMELEALERATAHDTNGALVRAREAAAAEDAMTFEFGPPAVVKPAHELLGEMLLASAKPSDASKEFDAALARAPGRALSLFGEIRAADAAGVTAPADAVRTWQANHRNADNREFKGAFTPLSPGELR